MDMTPRTYLRPTNIATAADASPDEAILLAGRKDLACATVQMISRAGSTRDTSHALSAAMLKTSAAGRTVEAAVIAGILERLESPRPALAHLSLDRPRIMGIVNVTPDSFSDGGLLGSSEAAIGHALRLAADGADILDIG